MPSAQEIISDVLARLREIDLLREVRLGPDEGGALPRVNVELLSEQTRQADDSPGQWHRLRLLLGIAVAEHSQASALERGMELCDLVRQTLLQDRFRSGHATDLPWGAATEFVSVSPGQCIKPPLWKLQLEMQCHFETSGEC